MQIDDCEHIVHEQGLHDFVFKKASRPAVDFLMDEMVEILKTTPMDEELRIIIDLEMSGLPPLRYAMTRSKGLTTDYFKDHEVAKHQHQTYIAFISTNTLIQTFKIFVEQFARGKTRIRIFADRDSALEWLLSVREEEAR